jgi:hypothetical protein
MHDLVDGLLTPPEAVDARGHLEACATCRDDFEALEAAVQALRDAPLEARPSSDLWNGIQARLETSDPAARPDGPDVVPLPVPGSLSGPGWGPEPGRVSGPTRRRFSLSVPQLAAAAVVVSLLSAGVVWTAMGGGALDGRDPALGVRTQPLDGPSARAVASGQAGYDEAVAELRTIIDQGRDVLSPETLSTLEASVATIDEAIAEVRDALADDPSSELLASLLANHQRSKLRVLRQAAIAAQPRS